MRLLHRRFDNTIQFASFSGVALIIVLSTRAPLALILSAALTLLAVRTLRAGVYADRAGFTIRNIFRTHRVAWDDFERVDIGRAGRPPIPTVLVSRRSGPPIALWCLQPSTRGKRAPERLVTLLRQVQVALGAAQP